MFLLYFQTMTHPSVIVLHSIVALEKFAQTSKYVVSSTSKSCFIRPVADVGVPSLFKVLCVRLYLGNQCLYYLIATSHSVGLSLYL